MINTKATLCANRYLLIAGALESITEHHAIHLSVSNQSNPFFFWEGTTWKLHRGPEVAVSRCAHGSNATHNH